MEKKIFKRFMSSAIAATVLLGSASDNVPFFKGFLNVTASADTYSALHEVSFKNPEGYAEIYGTNDELLYGYMQSQAFSKATAYSNISASGLNTYEKKVYDAIIAMAEKIANGESDTSTMTLTLTATYEELGLSSSTDINTVMNTFSAKVSTGKIYDIILADNPYLFYWHDKTLGAGLGGGNFSGDGTTVTWSNFSVMFRVGKEYRAAGSGKDDCKVNTAKTSSAKKAATNAAEIATANASKSDYEKIMAFAEKICELNTYNDEAAENGITPDYGTDPWQMIYVFDNDPATNVVCEGYSKAFMYLCELSGIDCYLIDGDCNGAHMWNHVVLDSNAYLVDITNCDAATSVGHPDQLILKGMTKVNDRSYKRVIDGYTLTYTYSDDVISITPANVLALSASDYVYTPPSADKTGFCGDPSVNNGQDVKYEFHESTGLLKITGTGAMADYSAYPQAPWYAANENWDSKIKTITIGEGVTSIGKNTFEGCTALESVQLPATLVKIDDSAFSNCAKLKTIAIPKNVKTIGSSAFIHCSALESIAIPSGVEAINEYTFYGCKALKSVTIPSTVKTLGESVFNGCAALETITIPSSVTTMGADSFAACTALKTISFEGTCATWTGFTGLAYDEAKVTVKIKTHSDVSTVWSSDNTKHWHACGCGAKADEADHAFTKKVVSAATLASEANCENNAKYYYSCECGKISTSKTFEAADTATGHIPSAAWEKNETQHWHVCSECNEKTDIADHKWNSGVITTEATEEATGVKTYTCTVCSAKREEVVAKLDHTHKPATSWTNDETGHWHICSGCDEKLDFASHAWDSGKVTKPATENEEGIKTYTCKVCGATKTETIAKIPTESLTPGAPPDPETPSSPGESTKPSNPGTSDEDFAPSAPPDPETPSSPGESTKPSNPGTSDESFAPGTPTEPDAPSAPSYPNRPSIPPVTPTTPDKDDNQSADKDEELEEVPEIWAVPSANGAIITWENVDGAESYVVYQHKNGKYRKIAEVDDNSIALKKLKNGKTYKFLVRARIDGELEAVKNAYKITVKANFKPDVEATVSNGTIRLTWNVINGAEKYSAYKIVNGKAKKIWTGNKLSLKITGTFSDTEYQFIVRVCINGKWTSMNSSDIVIIET